MNPANYGFTIPDNNNPKLILQDRINAVYFNTASRRVGYKNTSFPAHNSKQIKSAMTKIYRMYLNDVKSKRFDWTYFEGMPTIGGYRAYEFLPGFELFVREEDGMMYVTDEPKNPEGEIQYYSIGDFIDAAWTLYKMSDLPF